MRQQEDLERQKIPPIMIYFDHFNTYLSTSLPTARILPMHWVINFFKLLNGFIMIIFMNYYQNFTPTAFLFTSLFGLYGIIWTLKDIFFPDKHFQRNVSILSGLIIAIILMLYWMIGFLCISTRTEASILKIVFCILIYSLGLFAMLTSDIQKYRALKYKGNHLIQNGMFKYIRHPNYAGEILIYGTYGILANHWVAWVILVYLFITFFLPNMYKIDYSISRYPEWKSYKARTNMILPNISALLFKSSDIKKKIFLVFLHSM